MSYTGGPGATTSVSFGAKGPEKAGQGTKRTILPVLSREEATLVDYDFGLCSNQVEL